MEKDEMNLRQESYSGSSNEGLAINPVDSDLQTSSKMTNVTRVIHAESCNCEELSSKEITLKSPLIQITKTASIKPSINTLTKIDYTDDGMMIVRENINNKVPNMKDVPKQTHYESSYSDKPQYGKHDYIERKTLHGPNIEGVTIKTKLNTVSLQYITEQLKGSIFSGWVGEREYVDKLNEYRDVIEIDEWEDSINLKFGEIVNNIHGVKEGTKWINITGPTSTSPCYSIWVLLDVPPSPGHYWFLIEGVNIDNKFGLRIIIKILRSVNFFDGESFSQREKRLRGEISPDEWKDWVAAVGDIQFQDITRATVGLLTPSNISKFIRLSIILSVTLIVALCALIRETWDFGLRFLHEFGIFIHHATPFLESLLRFLEKLYGGFCILIAMIYRDLFHPPPPASPPTVNPPPAPKRLTYVSPQSWTYKSE